jgi:hypothetical protein
MHPLGPEQGALWRTGWFVVYSETILPNDAPSLTT